MFKKLTEDTLLNLGFEYNPQALEHSGNGAQFDWDGKSFDIYPDQYKIYQLGFKSDKFIQLLVKLCKDRPIIAIYIFAGNTHLEAFQFNLHYGRCVTEREFKKLMKKHKMWDRIKDNGPSRFKQIIKKESLSD